MNIRSVIVVAIFAACVASCRATSTEEAALRRITLPPDATVSIGVDSEGRSEVVVTIPPGHADAGTYISRSEAHLDGARDASASLGDPFASTAIGVDANHAIIVFSHEVTKR